MGSQTNRTMASYYGQHAQTHSQSAAAAIAQANASGQKHDVFCGNLAFNTTEEQLYNAFSEIGKVVKVRMVVDQETGKMRGFSFIEFEDPQAALSAIRNMNDYEMNGRKLRVNFSNSSHLETLASALGMDLSQKDSHHGASGGAKDEQGNAAAGGGASSASGGTKAVASALKSMNKGEMYDVVAKLKEIAETNPDEARKLLTSHPQLPEAILYCMSELDMVKTPVPGSSMSSAVPMAPPPVDPRSAPPSMPPPPVALQPPPTAAMAAMPADPRARAAPADPRAAARDPRSMPPPGSFPPPPPSFPAPPPMGPPPSAMAPGVAAGLDPGLVRQVMALTPAQISSLPPDKQQSIMALRNQITGGGMR